MYLYGNFNSSYVDILIINIGHIYYKCLNTNELTANDAGIV